MSCWVSLGWVSLCFALVILPAATAPHAVGAKLCGLSSMWWQWTRAALSHISHVRISSWVFLAFCGVVGLVLADFLALACFRVFLWLRLFFRVLFLILQYLFASLCYPWTPPFRGRRARHAERFKEECRARDLEHYAFLVFKAQRKGGRWMWKCLRFERRFMARNFSEPTLLADLEYLPQDTFLAPLLRMRRLRFCRRRVYHQNAGNLDLAVRALLRPSDEILDYLFTHVFSKVPLIGSTLCGLLVQVALGSTSYQLLLKKQRALSCCGFLLQHVLCMLGRCTFLVSCFVKLFAISLWQCICFATRNRCAPVLNCLCSTFAIYPSGLAMIFKMILKRDFKNDRSMVILFWILVWLGALFLATLLGLCFCSHFLPWFLTHAGMHALNGNISKHSATARRRSQVEVFGLEDVLSLPGDPNKYRKVAVRVDVDACLYKHSSQAIALVVASWSKSPQKSFEEIVEEILFECPEELAQMREALIRIEKVVSVVKAKFPKSNVIVELNCEYRVNGEKKTQKLRDELMVLDEDARFSAFFKKEKALIEAGKKIGAAGSARVHKRGQLS